jgi:hypothetical protein
LKQIEHKNIAADGEIGSIRWNDELVPEECIRNRLGEYEVQIAFPVSPRRWHEFPGKLSYDLIESFNANPESMLYCVDFPTKTASILVKLPPAKLCKHAEARKIQGAGEVAINGLAVSSDRRTLELKLRRPTYGAQYIIHWHW